MPDFAAAAAVLALTAEAVQAVRAIVPEAPDLDPYIVTINDVAFENNHPVFSWADLPGAVIQTRMPVQTITDPDGMTHRYEAVQVENGNLNWYQAAYLAEDACGYLASINSPEENAFVVTLVDDDMVFWSFEQDGPHCGISIGPFPGGYQPAGSVEPDGVWVWLDGTAFDYTNWAQTLDDGVIKSPTPSR